MRDPEKFSKIVLFGSYLIVWGNFLWLLERAVTGNSMAFLVSKMAVPRNIQRATDCWELFITMSSQHTENSLVLCSLTGAQEDQSLEPALSPGWSVASGGKFKKGIFQCVQKANGIATYVRTSHREQKTVRQSSLWAVPKRVFCHTSHWTLIHFGILRCSLMAQNRYHVGRADMYSFCYFWALTSWL